LNLSSKSLKRGNKFIKARGKGHPLQKDFLRGDDKKFAALLRVILNLGGKDTLSIKTSYEDR
jgi:hypothetical protein